jgi:F-type H+-transporting ATPase subunit epsilon
VHLRILTPERVVFSGEVKMVVMPAEIGPTGILPHHTPLLSKLKIGELKIIREEGEDYYAIRGGIGEICEEVVTIFTQEAVHAKEIDVERVKREKEEKERQLQEYKEKIDFAHFEAELEVLLNKLRIAEKKG